MGSDNHEDGGSIDLSTSSRYVVRDKRHLDFAASGSLGLHPELGHVTLELAIFTRSQDGHRSTVLRGKEQFSKMVAYFHGQFESIRAYWRSEDNLATFNGETAGVDPKDVAVLKAAALKTWTGIQAAAAGYSQVEIGPLEGSPGRYTSVKISFLSTSEIAQQSIGERSRPGDMSGATMSRLIGGSEQQLLETCFEISNGLASIQRDFMFSPGNASRRRQRSLPRINQEKVASLRMEIDEMKGDLVTAIEGCRRHGQSFSLHTQEAVRDISEIIQRTEEKLVRASEILPKNQGRHPRNQP